MYATGKMMKEKEKDICLIIMEGEKLEISLNLKKSELLLKLTRKDKYSTKFYSKLKFYKKILYF